MSSLVFARLTVEQEQLLGKSALSLYRVLRRLRGKASVTRGVCAKLNVLAFEADLSYNTAQRALVRLRECGAVRTSRVYVGGDHEYQNRYFVRGKIMRGKFWLPSTVEKWCRGRNKHGGHRGQDAVYLEQNDRQKSNDASDLLRQDAASYIHNYSYVSDTSFSFGERRDLRSDSEFSARKLRTMTKWPHDIQRALDRGSINEVEAELLLPRPDDPAPRPLVFPFTPAELQASLGEGVRRVLQHRRDNPRPSMLGDPPVLPPLCPVRKVKLGYEELEAGLKPKVMVGRMLQGYEEATSNVYGSRRSQTWFKGVRNLETQARLLKAGRWLQDRGIAPGAWAHWQLSYAKAQGMTPWGPARIFVVSRMEKMETFFFQNYDGPQGVREEWTDAHREQVFRRQEAMARWENKTPNALSNVGTPWYREMRKSEIARGMVDPLDGYMKV